MKTPQFKPGDTVYNQYGQIHEYVCPHPNGEGHVCVPWFETGSGDDGPVEWRGDPVSVRYVFAEPDQARQKADAKLVELNAKVDAARLELAGLHKERSTLDNDARDRLARLKQHAALKHLDDYLAGKITHFVVMPSYGSTVFVKSLADALKSEDMYAREMRLLSLYGTSNGDLQFKITQYSEGSGGACYEAFPFTSEEAARSFAKELVAKELASCIKSGNKDGNGMPSYFSGWAKTAAEWGVPVPEDMLARQKAIDITNAEKLVADAEKKLAEMKAYLETKKGGAA